MNLAKYYGKRVEIKAINGLTYIGDVNEYFEPEDNDNGQESIIVDTVPERQPIEFNENHIKTISIIDKS